MAHIFTILKQKLQNISFYFITLMLLFSTPFKFNLILNLNKIEYLLHHFYIVNKKTTVWTQISTFIWYFAHTPEDHPTAQIIVRIIYLNDIKITINPIRQTTTPRQSTTHRQSRNHRTTRTQIVHTRRWLNALPTANHNRNSSSLHRIQLLTSTNRKASL